MKPVIGLVADVHAGKHIAHSVHQKYLEAVSAGADATILILPALIDAPGAAFTNADDLTAILTLLDGLFLTGATSNVAPARYGATPQHPDSPSDPARDHVTLALVRAAVAAGTPVLGVCRGCQEINVALGGTLHQSVHTVPGLADHREPPRRPRRPIRSQPHRNLHPRRPPRHPRRHRHRAGQLPPYPGRRPPRPTAHRRSHRPGRPHRSLPPEQPERLSPRRAVAPGMAVPRQSFVRRHLPNVWPCGTRLQESKAWGSAPNPVVRSTLSRDGALGPRPHFLKPDPPQ